MRYRPSRNNSEPRPAQIVPPHGNSTPRPGLEMMTPRPATQVEPSIKPRPGLEMMVPRPNAASRAGTGMSNSVDLPGWRPPPAPVPAPPPAYVPPTTQASSNYQRDPRIEELLKELQRSETGGTSGIGTLDLSGIEAQSSQLRALLAQLMRGEGVKVGDLSNDPAQRAYELKTQRAAERLRESEAARAGATGGADAGGFDGRVAQIMTETGESNAANMADLINKRRSEKLATALAGANLQMSDLSRQAANKQAEHGSTVERERLRLAAESAKGADKQRLLEMLMMQDRQQRESQERDSYYNRDLAERRRIEEREQAERLRLEALDRNPGGPYVPYNPYKRPSVTGGFF